MNAPTKSATQLTNHLVERTGAQILVDALRVHGTDTIFCVPGESYLAVLDALYDHRETIRLVVARQDGGASYMAEAWGKTTGRPAVCFVTRGPGATNASVGLHTAWQDSTPMILFIGQVPNEFVEREAFQEVDYRRMFGQMAKWVAQIDDPARVPEYVSHAFHVAMSGRPGPVVLALPEDMLIATATAADTKPFKRIQAAPTPDDMTQLQALFAKAKKPLALVGGTVWTQEACAEFKAFAEGCKLPVAAAFRFQDLFDNHSASYVGDVGIGVNPQLAQAVKECDLLLVVGPRLGEMTTLGYTLVEAPVPRQTLVHVHGGAEELGRVYQGELLINAGMPVFAKALRGLKVDGSAWKDWTKTLRANYEAWQQPRPNVGEVQMAGMVQWLRGRVPADTILCTGAGNFTGWFQRYWRFPGLRTQVAPTSGSMGYGTPAGVAAKVAHPDRLVISVNGDGDYMMNGQELATAVQENLGILFIVVNNGMYGTIRMHQEREYPARVHGTALRNPDFAALARAYGALGELVVKTEEFAPAVERALAHVKTGVPALIEVRIDPEAITTVTTLSAIRNKTK